MHLDIVWKRHFRPCWLNPFHYLQYAYFSRFWVLNCLNHMNEEHTSVMCFEKLDNILVHRLKNRYAVKWEQIRFKAFNLEICGGWASQLSRNKWTWRFSLMNRSSGSRTYFSKMFLFIYSLVFASYFVGNLLYLQRVLIFTICHKQVGDVFHCNYS